MSMFADIFQATNQRNPDGKTVLVKIFCTIPKTSSCWDTVIAAYTVMMHEKGHTSFQPATATTALLSILSTNKDTLFNPENIENFDSTVATYLAEITAGTRNNRFFHDPEWVILDIIDFLEELAINTGGGKKGILDSSRKSVTEILNRPGIKEAIQKEISDLFSE